MKTHRLVLFLLVMCFNKIIIGQNDTVRKVNYSLSFGYGISLLTDNLEPNRPNNEYSSFWQKTYATGLSASYNLSTKSYLSLGTYYSQLNSKWGYYYSPSGTPNSILETFIKIHNLSIVVDYTFFVKRFHFAIGTQYSILLSNRVNIRQAYPSYNFDTTTTANGDKLLLNSFGICSSISYPVINKLHIEIKYAHGLTDVTNYEGGMVNESKTRQLLLGVRYFF